MEKEPNEMRSIVAMWLRRVVLVLIVVLVALVHLRLGCAYAEEPCKKAYLLTDPCEGVLLPTDAAAAGLTCLSVDLPKEVSLRLKTQKLLTLDIKYWSGKYKAQKEFADGLQIKYDELLEIAKEAEVVDWYEHPLFWFGSGFLTGVVIMSGLVVVVN
jgi:hypothetical protein